VVCGLWESCKGVDVVRVSEQLVETECRLLEVDVTLEPRLDHGLGGSGMPMRLPVDLHVLVVVGRRVNLGSASIQPCPSTIIAAAHYCRPSLSLASARRIHRLLIHPHLHDQHGPLRIASDLPLGQ
jgi:hypothetical protein